MICHVVIAFQQSPPFFKDVENIRLSKIIVSKMGSEEEEGIFEVTKIIVFCSPYEMRRKSAIVPCLQQLSTGEM